MMPTIDILCQRMLDQGDQLALAAGDKATSYADLLAQYHDWNRRWAQAGVRSGQVAAIEGEYGEATVAAMLAALNHQLILVPLSADSRVQHEEFRRLAQVEIRLKLDAERFEFLTTGAQAGHELYDALREKQRPGLVLFTSGSTGQSKAVVHDMTLLLEKFLTRRRRLRTIVFLQLDHIGGVNTLYYTLFNGGAVVVPPGRSPQAVCQAIVHHQAELLPTSPTFLNLLLLSEEDRRHDLSCLRWITYGTEPMPASTLERLQQAFPNLKLKQTYGLTELGILQSESRDSGSLWVRVGGDGYETKVVDGRLWIRGRTAMLGYLNAPCPFDEEGFFDTQDQVEQDGQWLRILGRRSEIVNVGGNKVYPAEVESVLLELDGVLDAAVAAEAHPITGHVVAATVLSSRNETPRDFRIRMRQFLKGRLPPFAVPVRVRLTDGPLHNTRFKRVRNQA